MKSTRLLIVYNTTHGQTERIAHRIADAAASVAGVEAVVASVDDAEESAIALADLVVIAGPVHFDRHDRKLVEFVREHLGILAQRSSAFVSISGHMASFGGRPEAEKYADAFLEATGWIPDRVELFAGALAYRKYNPLLRFVMRWIASRNGLDTDTSRNYDYTDWEAVDAFARELVTNQRKTSAA